MNDFNDLHQNEGVEAVQKAVDKARQLPYVPSGYRIDNSGVARIDGDAVIPICDPLYVVALAREPDSGGWGRLLQWRDPDDKQHEWALPSGMLGGDGAEYRSILLDQGLGIRGSRKANSELHDYILACNPPARARSVSIPGWHAGRYVAPDGTVYGDGVERVLLQIAGVPPKLEKTGTLETWKKIAGFAVGNSRLVFALSIPFSGSLLLFANESGGGFHYAGGSSTGKTTALRLAASVSGTAMRTWRTTDNAAESWAKMANDGFLALDELSQVDGRSADAMAYLLGNGQTKGRANRNGVAREAVEFRTMFLSTGETGLADKIGEGHKKVKAGQTVRMLEIPADAGCGMGIFEELHGFKNGDEFAKHLHRFIEDNKGHAMAEFLTRLVKNSPEALSKAISMLTETWMREHVPNGADGQVKRAARRFALVAVAGELASAAGILPWPDKTASDAAARCFRDWMTERGGSGSHEVQEGIKAILSFIERHGNSRFQSINQATPDSHEEKIYDRAGFKEKMGDGITWMYYIDRGTLCKDVLGGIHNLDAIVQAAVEERLIIPGKELNTQQKMFPGLGKKRVFCVSPALRVKNHEADE